MKKKCLSCGRSFNLSGSGKRQKLCAECRKRGIVQSWGFSRSNPLKIKGPENHISMPVPPPRKPHVTRWNPTAAALNRPIIVVGRNDSISNLDDALGVLKGFRVRLCIEAEKELQILGCGWRIVTCQFRGKNVLLHSGGNAATMKRQAFKSFLATMRAIKPKRLRLRLVVSNPLSAVVTTRAKAA
jgi:hypothetical protein